MVEGPIPWTAVDLWAERHGVTGEQREDLHFYVRALDRAFLDWRRTQKAEG